MLWMAQADARSTILPPSTIVSASLFACRRSSPARRSASRTPRRPLRRVRPLPGHRNGNWDAHKVGWLIAGVTAAIVRPALVAPLAQDCALGCETTARPRRVLLLVRRADSVVLNSLPSSRSCSSSCMRATTISRRSSGRSSCVLVGGAGAGTGALTHSDASLPLCPQRIILMPPVYAIVSFFSYRFFRAYT